MQDEFQGVGGTINMNWWFTNQAVLLDTAGRLMFEEVKPGETSEWKEFLTLLKKNRPTCPINGLFLVIPSDSLIKDSADAIQKKAGKIAQQLDVIQRVLDVRFPVFVVVTKCDKINGFREFFDGLTDPLLQHQMVGWSNPDPLDEPFKPEMVDKHLEQVASRLRRRRLGLLRDPVPENAEGRRTDEVDSLYAFPHSLEMLSSRLHSYLATIFIAGEWSAKPLFLRGIYFSSSMREGAALDAELAEAIGVGVDELPEGKVWERERAYFLRDLFIEKVFREKGLVTRATNTKRMLRGQQIALYGFGFISLAVFAAVAWFAVGNLRSSVKDQGDYWTVVKNAGWEQKFWRQSIVPMLGDGSFTSSIQTNTFLVDNKPVTLGQFHWKLAELARKPLKQNWMFPHLAESYNQKSRRAQRIVFEDGVVRPLLEATRRKMTRADGSASAYGEPDALAMLIQFEADILSRGTGTNTGELSREGATKFLSGFENYIAGQEMAMDTNLVTVMASTYSTNDSGKGLWAPSWLSGGQPGTNTLAVNAGINAGLELFIRSATDGVQTNLAEWDQISSLRNAVNPFDEAEKDLFNAVDQKRADEFRKALEKVETARKNLEAERENASHKHLFTNSLSLMNALLVFREEVSSGAGAALVRVRGVNEAALAANKDYPLFRDIKGRLDKVQTSINNQVSNLLRSGDTNEFQKFDELYLSDGAFLKRANLYNKAKNLKPEKPFSGESLIGAVGKPLDNFLNGGLGALRDEAAAFKGSLTNELNRAISFQSKLTEKDQIAKFFDAYLSQARNQTGSGGGFPLVTNLAKRMTAESFRTAGQQLKKIALDLDSQEFKSNAPQDNADWDKFVASIRQQQTVAKALLGEEMVLGTCSISLAGVDSTRPEDAWRDTWRDMKMKLDGGNNDGIRTDNSLDDQKLGEAQVDQKIELVLTRNAGGSGLPTLSIATGEWGTLEWIHKFKGEKDKADPTGKTWLVRVPPGGQISNGVVRLKLKFETVLPDVDKWPTQ